jgi:hypothetical protein
VRISKYASKDDSLVGVLEEDEDGDEDGGRKERADISIIQSNFLRSSIFDNIRME